ncbi:methylated-DNA--[protein]-cysteine S-methyltransferase [Stappia sp. ES.058]|uniref:methylated-DNA--[protein]-cysteine S-methyltransferase n=1 Tax=Stappia sp. ES.058 TaxID=1881061 RepID=UPI00087BA8D6|nr:methylated-DNA--[protein]-cysteine S-methyltransferase [Stappia sp. ES.058]SDU36727.1 methylated-DNA-[protein]-cysteine S-methyltransferase [Stappia sp. ES.058]
MTIAHISSPVGDLELEERDGALVRLSWVSGDRAASSPLLKEAARQIEAYFAGDLLAFDLPLAPAGNAFRQDVYKAMCAIPYGETATYGEIAAALSTSAQPVGQACGGNPVPIVIPCHRVVSATGLGGYSGAGGVETKIALLKLEGGFRFLL